MNCELFHELWNEWLDQERSPRGALGTQCSPSADERQREAAAHDHALRCPECQSMRASYLVLRKALRAWGASQPASLSPGPEVLERILLAARDERPSPRRVCSGRTIRRALAVAAGLVLLAIPLYSALSRNGRNEIPVGRVASVLERARAGSAASIGRPLDSSHDDPRRLAEALEGATKATLELARITSGPAARLGREMLQTDGTGVDVTSPPRESTSLLTLPSVFRSVQETASAPAMLQQVGSQLASSVQPFSTTAWHAFGFLRSPALEKPETPPRVPASKGA